MALLVVAAFAGLLVTCFLMARRLGELEEELATLRERVGSIAISPVHERTVTPSRIGRMYANAEPGLTSRLMKLPGAIGLAATALFTILSAGASLVQVQADETRFELADELAQIRASLDSMKTGFAVFTDSVRVTAPAVTSRMAASVPRGGQTNARRSGAAGDGVVPAPVLPPPALPTAP